MYNRRYRNRQVIITDNQLQHILDRHQKYIEVADYLNDIISALILLLKITIQYIVGNKLYRPKNLDLKGRLL